MLAAGYRNGKALVGVRNYLMYNFKKVSHDFRMIGLGAKAE